MISARKSARRRRHGVALIISMIFVLVFSSLGVALFSMSGTNVQLASNQHKVNAALLAAQSGLECGKYIVATASLDKTSHNFVTDAEAHKVWSDLYLHIQNNALDGQFVPPPARFADAVGSGDQIVTSPINFGSTNVDFTIRFYRYDGDPRTIKLQATGTDGDIGRSIKMDMKITKDRSILEYAVAGRGRMWLTGNTTIHGNVFSSWDRADISPFNMTSDSRVEGTVNTVLSLQQIQSHSYQLETLDANDQPVDVNGDPLGDNFESRYYSANDEIQAYHEGINYGQPHQDMPGMDISDYNTDCYNVGLTNVPTSAVKVVEYFPHAAGNYSLPRDASSTSFTRNVYENETFTNTSLPKNRHALFKNCTFEDVLYIDCSKTSTSKSYTNNVRFDNCTFNGTIVSNVPQPFNWKNNCLYFTGEATFNNQSGIQEATILAPHFNVNLGNTNPQKSDNNVLTGAIVGGIVDVRGNAQIYGTIISMFDATAYSSGYVTNIGATLDDGGTETTELGDVGVISITPEEDTMLPSGISSRIIIQPMQNTYCEG